MAADGKLNIWVEGLGFVLRDDELVDDSPDDDNEEEEEEGGSGHDRQRAALYLPATTDAEFNAQFGLKL